MNDLYRKICDASSKSGWYDAAFLVCAKEYPHVPHDDLQGILRECGVHAPTAECNYQGSMSPMDSEKLLKMLSEYRRSEGIAYDADYYLRGKQTGVSLYEDYRWMPELTVPMVGAIRDHLFIEQGETVLDFGCARGYIVKAFREVFEIEAYGI